MQIMVPQEQYFCHWEYLSEWKMGWFPKVNALFFFLKMSFKRSPCLFPCFKFFIHSSTKKLLVLWESWPAVQSHFFSTDYPQIFYFKVKSLFLVLQTYSPAYFEVCRGLLLAEEGVIFFIFCCFPDSVIFASTCHCFQLKQCQFSVPLGLKQAQKQDLSTLEYSSWAGFLSDVNL